MIKDRLVVETEITKIEDLGDLTRIEVSVFSKTVCFHEYKKVGYIDRGTEFHKHLHDDQVTHSHNNSAVQEVFFLASPYTEADLENELVKLRNAVEADSNNLRHCSHSDVLETQYTKGGSVKSFYHATKVPEETITKLRNAFPDLDISKHMQISSPAYHEILEEEVVSTYLWEWGKGGLINGEKLLSRSRKYCLSSKKYFDRCYKYTEDSFGFLPPSAKILAVGYNTNIQEGLELPDFFDVYFACDPEVAEAFFDFEPNRGIHRTYYAVTVVDDAVVRVKQYCYDQLTVISEWEKYVKDHKEFFA